MQKLFSEDQTQKAVPTAAAGSWPTRIMGLVGAAIIWWIVLRSLAPVLVDSWGIIWLDSLTPKIAITAVAALVSAVFLARIEGTIWARYYVIIGFLLSLFLIIWIALRLLRYV